MHKEPPTIDEAWDNFKAELAKALTPLADWLSRHMLVTRIGSVLLMIGVFVLLGLSLAGILH